MPMRHCVASCAASRGPAAASVRLVDEPEVALETVDDARVGAQQRPVGAQQMLEGRLPPRELELGTHALLGNVTHRQLDEELLQAQTRELGTQLRALDEVVEEGRLGGEPARVRIRRCTGRVARRSEP